MYDIDAIRRDFPILQTTMRGKPFVYLDSGATSLKPQSVIDAELAYYRDFGVNIHRGVYEFSERATRLHAETRKKVAHLINARESAEVIFTAGTTEAVNLVAYGWGHKFLKAGDVVLTTDLEHHSSIVPWQAACQKTGARLEFLPLDPTSGELDLSNLDRIMAEGVKLVVVTAMSNVSGYMPPLEIIIASAHRHGALVLVDGAQFVSHHAIDVQNLDCDFLAFSAHKMLGPTGVGVLWAKRHVLVTMDPFLYGGDMILDVQRTVSTYQDIPERFEAGTPNIAGIIAFATAIEYLESLGLDRITAWEQNLLKYAIARGEEFPWITRYGPADLGTCGGVFAFNAKGVHSHDIGTILDSQGIAVRTGFHCAMPYMAQLGTSGTVRATFYLYTTTAEIDKLFVATEQAYRMFS